MQLRTLTNQFHHMRPIQPARSAGEDAGTQFDHQGLTATHIFLPSVKKSASGRFIRSRRGSQQQHQEKGEFPAGICCPVVFSVMLIA